MDTRYVKPTVNLEERIMWRLQSGNDFRPTGRLERDCQDIADIYEASDAGVLEADLKNFPAAVRSMRPSCSRICLGHR